MSDILETILRKINKNTTNKCQYRQQKTLDGDTLVCITFDEETTTKLGELQYVVSEFLKVYQFPERFVVEVDITKKDRDALAGYFYNYLITVNQNDHLLFRKKSKY